MDQVPGETWCCVAAHTVGRTVYIWRGEMARIRQGKELLCAWYACFVQRGAVRAVKHGVCAVGARRPRVSVKRYVAARRYGTAAVIYEWKGDNSRCRMLER